MNRAGLRYELLQTCEAPIPRLICFNKLHTCLFVVILPVSSVVPFFLGGVGLLYSLGPVWLERHILCCTNRRKQNHVEPVLPQQSLQWFTIFAYFPPPVRALHDSHERTQQQQKNKDQRGAMVQALESICTSISALVTLPALSGGCISSSLLNSVRRQQWVLSTVGR